MIEVNRNPTTKELRVFAVGEVVFFIGIAVLVFRETGSLLVPTVIVVTATAIGVGGWFVPSFLRPIYVAWMLAVFPIGWVVSHVLTAVVFYLVITPIGFMMRVCGRDPMQRRFDPAAQSYWKPRRPGDGTERYFRQF